MWVLRVIAAPETGEVGVGVAVQTKVIGGIEDEAFVEGALEIATDAKEGEFVRALRSEGVPGALMDGKEAMSGGCDHIGRGAFRRHWHS